jgi:hypothetical protein
MQRGNGLVKRAHKNTSTTIAKTNNHEITKMKVTTLAFILLPFFIAMRGEAKKNLRADDLADEDELTFDFATVPADTVDYGEVRRRISFRVIAIVDPLLFSPLVSFFISKYCISNRKRVTKCCQRRSCSSLLRSTSLTISQAFGRLSSLMATRSFSAAGKGCSNHPCRMIRRTPVMSGSPDHIMSSTGTAATVRSGPISCTEAMADGFKGVWGFPRITVRGSPLQIIAISIVVQRPQRTPLHVGCTIACLITSRTGFMNFSATSGRLDRRSFGTASEREIHVFV